MQNLSNYQKIKISGNIALENQEVAVKHNQKTYKMKKNSIILLLVLMTFNIACSHEIDKRYKGGELTFRKFIATSITYPLNSRNNAIVGLSLASITIDKNGKIKETNILNSLDNDIDADVLRVMNESQKFWLPGEKEEDITFIIPIKFSFTSFTFKQDKFVNDNLLKEVEVTAFGSGTLESDRKIYKRYKKSIKTKEEAKAISYISELIRRNPYKADYYIKRAILNKEIGETKKACQDLKVVEEFLKQSINNEISIDCP